MICILSLWILSIIFTSIPSREDYYELLWSWPHINKYVSVNGGFIGTDLGRSSNDLSHNLKDWVVEKVSTSIVYICGLAGPKYTHF